MGNKKIIVDTSVWIEYFKNNDKFVLLIENNLNLEKIFITGIIISELLHGVRNYAEYKMLSKSIDAIPYLECIFDDWLKTGKILFELKRKNIPVPLTDVLIATIAIRNDASVLTLDKHFENIIQITPLNLYPCFSIG